MDSHQGNPFSIFCLSSQDWRAELPTNRHQIMLRAARRNHRVLFVETGAFTGKHLLRLLGRGHRRSLALRLFATEAVAPNIRARKALNLVPWGHKYSFASRLNSALTALVLRRLARRLPKPLVLWIYDPWGARMIGRLGEAAAVYDCVDDYTEQAGSDPRRRALTNAGDELSASLSRLIFTTTRPLYERQRGRNQRTFLVPNAGDYAHFVPAADRSFAAPEVEDLPRPVLGFAGNFLPSKVDLGLLEELAAAKPGWTILLVGPSRSGSEHSLERLSKLPNVRWLGARPYEELPRYVAAFDVGLIPYVDNAYTRSCFPLKLYEYLAAGKPVVASGLPELAGMEPDVVVASGVAEFATAVEAALGLLGEEERARRTALAARNTWEKRTETLLGLVAAELRN